MRDLKACTVCFSINEISLKLYHLDNDNLRNEYNLVSGLTTEKDSGLPAYLCFECAAYVKKFRKFRDKCQRAFYTLQQIMYKDEIKKSTLKLIDRKCLDLQPSLSYLNSKNAKVHEFKFQWDKFIRPYIPRDKFSISHCSTLPDNLIEIEVPIVNDVKIEENVYEMNYGFVDNSNEILDDICDMGTEKDDEQQDVSYYNDVDDSDTQISNLDDSVSDNKVVKEKETADGLKLEEEYASMVPISKTEAKAVVEVYKMFSTGKSKCVECGKGYNTQQRLDVHMRMHDQHVSGTFYCELCKYYYKTEFLLKTHMTEKHLYKYLCKKCPEVNFDRTSAKQHFIWAHLQIGVNKDANWYDSRPTWISKRGGRRIKNISLQPVKKNKILPLDFPKLSVVTQEEQYALITDRKNTRNYIESVFKCELCFKGFREQETFSKHMRKHDPSFAGPLQCDMCKLFFKNTRVMYKHMIITHLLRYTCPLCEYVCFSRGQAHQHYRWHKNVTYKCTQCDKVFKKHSTRLTHIRIKHPSTELCSICGHSFVSGAGLYFHKKRSHCREEIELSEKIKVDINSPLYCAECNIQFVNDAAFGTHLGSSSKHAQTNLSVQNHINKRPKMRPRRVGERKRARRSSTEIVNNGFATGTQCEICGTYLANDVQARRHYTTEHPGAEFLKRYMCDVCGHTTKQYTNLLVHMRTHTREKPYACPHCDRRFSMPSNRDRHLVVHTGEKRYQCEHCQRRFTQSSAVKLHIQTVHLKIPYGPWDKKNRKRKKEMETPMTQSEPKLHVEATGEFINAFITYND